MKSWLTREQSCPNNHGVPDGLELSYEVFVQKGELWGRAQCGGCSFHAEYRIWPVDEVAKECASLLAKAADRARRIRSGEIEP